MNWKQIGEEWRLLRYTCQDRWAKLNDSDLDYIAGRKERLIGLLQLRYSMATEWAERQSESWAQMAAKEQ